MNYRDYIRTYVLNLIPGGRESGDEYVAPSPLQKDDFKRHFSLNMESGLWQDWKLGEAGNLFHLVSILKNVPYETAKQMVLFKLFDKLDFDFFPKSNNPTPTSSIKQILEESKLEEVKQDWIDSPDEVKFRALGFLIERDLLGGFRQYYLATDGPLKNRLVIPYISDNKIYYFQARRLFDYHNPKYLTPSSDCGIDKRSILYPFRSDVSFLVVTEGPVDAITLQCDELNATCIMGSHITKEQMDLLKQFKGKLIVGFNNDDPRKYPGKTPPGLQGLHYFSKVARQKCLSEFYYCFPPNPYKDWNDMWVAGESCNDYIFKNYKKFDTFEWKMKLTNNGSVNFTTSGIIQGTII